MNKEFLDYYQANLEYLRKLGAEFAQDFPKIAARLELSDADCQDPYVERLLEGTAFLAARVEKKLDDGNPRLLESILASAAPQTLAPLPSFAVLELQNIDPATLTHNNVLTAGTRFSAAVPGAATQCCFTTLWDAPLYDISLTELKYLTLELGKYRLAAEAGLAFSFDVNCGNLPAEPGGDPLLFLNMPDSEASDFLRQLQTDAVQLFVRQGEKYEAADGVRFVIPELDRDATESVKLPGQLRGLQIFHRFMAFQPGFRFVCVKGFSELLKKARDGKLELILTLKRRDAQFIHTLNGNSVKLNCVPAVNLFRKRSDRCPLDIQHEFHVMPERTAPEDYEIADVLGVELFDAANQKILDIRKFYDDHENFGREVEREYFAIHRRDRVVYGAQAQRSSYRGSEVFLSFSGPVIREHLDQSLQFTAETICSNRDLPLLIRSGTVLSASGEAQAKSALFAVPPSRPEPPLIADGGREAWEKISYLTLNLSSLLRQDGLMPLKMLRELIRLYSPRSAEEMEKLQQGIAELRCEPEMFRYIRHGSVFFENGWAVRLTLDEPCFPGTGFYLFALVLRELLRSYSPVNAPVRIELSTKQQGAIAEWTI